MGVGVLGASGLVGATLCERLVDRGSDVVAFVNTAGNAWRLARDPRLDIRVLDLLNRDAVRASLEGCTHVVNATRGDEQVMLAGLRNLLHAASARGIQRLIHLSSVLVYGDPPVPESRTENAPTRPARGTYGWIKLRQDEMVQAASAGGLSAVCLCPPNITGPYSYFLLQLIDALRAGGLALVDGGARPCEVVDVRNLCRAIELALVAGPKDGRRLFVTDDDNGTTWADVVGPISALMTAGERVPAIREDELCRRLAAAQAAMPRGSLWRSLTHLVSSDVRAALRKDPLLEKADRFVRGLVARMGPRVEDRLRHSIEGSIQIAVKAGRSTLNTRLCGQQLRGIRHSCEAARREIGYRPEISFQESMQDFGTWFRAMSGMDNAYGDLTCALT